MSYAPLPAVPQVGIPEWQFQFLNGVKQNIEILTGQRGDTGFQSLIARQVGIRTIGDLNLKQVTAQGAGFTISGVQVAGLDDYSKLIVDVQTLIGDVALIKDVLNTLITQLRSDN
jgi:hypothetical protein